MKHIKILFVIIAILSSMMTTTKSQTTHKIDYSTNNANISTSSCNVFYVATPISVDGYKHWPLCGGVTYDSTELILATQYSIYSSSNLGTAYAINFPFKAGYLYQFSINTKGIDGSNTNNYPTVFTTLSDAIPDPNTSNPTACNAVPQTNWGFLLSYPVLYSFQTINSFTTYNSPGTYTAPATKTPKYLFILAYGGGSSPNQVLIKSVTITETPPTAFSLAASSTFIPCGNTQPITFTITGTGVPQGASLSYNFNIGTGNNGWLYNGAAAPSNIITSANSISLTPVCGSSLSNISATVSLNGTNYTTNSVKVSILQPNLSINGVTSFCNGSNNYFINNLPCNATVNWSASPFGIANLTTNGNIATLTQTGNGDVFLQAAVNNVCGQNYPSITQTIHIGTPSPPTITNLNYDNTCGTFAEAYCDIPANTTGFIWNFNYGQIIQNNPGTSGNYFLLKPLGQNKVGFTYYDYLIPIRF